MLSEGVLEAATKGSCRSTPERILFCNAFSIKLFSELQGARDGVAADAAIAAVAYAAGNRDAAIAADGIDTGEYGFVIKANAASDEELSRISTKVKKITNGKSVSVAIGQFVYR